MPGNTGNIIATLTKPDGSQLSATIAYEILVRREEKGTKAKGLVPPFDIIQLDPFDDKDREVFEQVWDKFEPHDDVASVAYKAVQGSGKTNVYYSTAFAAYAAQMEKIKHDPAMAQLFRRQYKIWIGYHAILQFQHRLSITGLTEEQEDQLDQTLERERAIVAEMQVKQALKASETLKLTMAKSATE